MPKVIVTFYENFRYKETDISKVTQTFAVASGAGLTYEITENLVELIEEEHEPEEAFIPKFELIETRHYTEVLPFLPRGQAIPIKVVGTEGTWRIKIAWNDFMKIPILDGEGHVIGLEEREPTFSAPIPAVFTAADVLAAFAGTLLQPLPNTGSGLEEPTQPVPLFVESQVFYKKGEPPRAPGYSTFQQLKLEGEPAAFIRCFDTGSQEIRFELFGGFVNFQIGAVSEDIDLAGVIEVTPEDDKIEYEIDLEEGDCTGGLPEPEPGDLQVENPCAGRKAVFRPVSGHRS